MAFSDFYSLTRRNHEIIEALLFGKSLQNVQDILNKSVDIDYL